ncbi:hypothetical protein CCP4SC76_3500012 [Gammaproteobacteria bacterium]
MFRNFLSGLGRDLSGIQGYQGIQGIQGGVVRNRRWSRCNEDRALGGVKWNLSECFLGSD